MKGVLVISTVLALLAMGSVRTHSGPLMSQASVAASENSTPPATRTPPANASPARQLAARTPAMPPDGSAGSTAATKSAPRGARGDRVQQPVASSTTTRDARVVPTAMLAPASLPSSPRLVAKIQSLLPAGVAADQAAFGFRTQMQFVSAVFAARNLDIPFGELKTRLLTHGMSLDQSIHALRPGVDATVEADRALRQADAELENPD
jgi:hypothetical protein